MRHAVRNTLLTLAYAHPLALGVAVRRGPSYAKRYLEEIYRCSKSDAGLHLPIVKLDDLVAEETEFSVVRPPSWAGSMTIAEISSLAMLVASRNPQKVLEIGTFQGLTTLNMARNAPHAMIHTIDLPAEADATETAFDTADPAIVGRRGHYYYAEAPEASQIVQHRGDTATFDFTAIGDHVDICLIDAAHSYQYVKNDTTKALPLMTDSGLLLWHDYGRNDFLADPNDAWGVSKFLHEVRDAGVRILHGTSLGVLQLTRANRAVLSAKLVK
jgi:predicted O-methyltransferase YrrM